MGKFKVGDKVSYDGGTGIITRPHEDAGRWWVKWDETASKWFRGKELHSGEDMLTLINTPLSKLEAANKAKEILEEAGYGTATTVLTSLNALIEAHEAAVLRVRQGEVLASLGALHTDPESYGEEGLIIKAVNKIIELKDAAK